MAKDAKGHGSDTRGSYQNVSTKALRTNAARDRLAAARNDPNHPLGVLTRVVSQGTPIAGQDAAAASNLAGGHPKSAPVPVHSGADGPQYNREAVNNAIASSNRAGRRIGGKEASAIHRLLRGRH